MEAHGDGHVGKDWHKHVGGGGVAADVGDEHGEAREDETGNPAREGGHVHPDKN